VSSGREEGFFSGWPGSVTLPREPACPPKRFCLIQRPGGRFSVSWTVPAAGGCPQWGYYAWRQAAGETQGQRPGRMPVITAEIQEVFQAARVAFLRKFTACAPGVGCCGRRSAPPRWPGSMRRAQLQAKPAVPPARKGNSKRSAGKRKNLLPAGLPAPRPSQSQSWARRHHVNIRTKAGWRYLAVWIRSVSVAGSSEWKLDSGSIPLWVIEALSTEPSSHRPGPNQRSC